MRSTLWRQLPILHYLEYSLPILSLGKSFFFLWFFLSLRWMEESCNWLMLCLTGGPHSKFCERNMNQLSGLSGEHLVQFLWSWAIIPSLVVKVSFVFITPIFIFDNNRISFIRLAFSDDLALILGAVDESTLMERATGIKEHKLILVPQKTEAVIVGGSRRRDNAFSNLKKVRITPVR